MEDVLDVYEKPYNKDEPVVCLDEKPVQLFANKNAEIPARKPGQIAKQDYEYVRCGTANIFTAVEPEAGKRITKVTKKRKGADFAKFLNQVSHAYPDAKTIHLVMDNLNTHTLKSLIRFYGDKQAKNIWSRFTLHYTPKHASWLNQAEIDINVLTAQCIRGRRIPDITQLRSKVRAWNRSVNKKKMKISWKFTKKKAKKKFRY